MVDEDNFAYILPQSKVTNEEVMQSLQDRVSSYKKYTVSSLIAAVAIPYLAEKYDGNLPDSLETVIYSGMLLGELLTIGTCCVSAYTWWKASRNIKELEQNR